MENLYQQDYPLTYTHIDCHGRLRPGALFQFMQDAATSHAEQLRIARDDIGAYWVLSRLRVTLDRPLRVHETLSLTSWCAGIKGATWLRGFRFFVNGEPVGRAMSNWVVIDPESRKLLRPSAIAASQYYQNAPAEDIEIPGKLRLTRGPLHHTHTIRYSDLDVNQHLNNARIVELITDALEPEHRPDAFIRTLQVNYTAESVAGETLELCVGPADGDGCIPVHGRCGEERFAAAVTFAPV